MKRLISSIILMIIASGLSGQILTVTTNATSNIAMDYDITIQQHFHNYPDERLKKQRFSHDYVQLSKKELLEILESNAIEYTELENTIDTINYRNTNVIELIDTVYHFALSKPDDNQLKALKEINPKKKNNINCFLSNVEYLYTEEFYQSLTQDAIKSAKTEVEKLAKALDRSVTDLQEVEMMSFYPYNLTSQEQSTIPLNTYFKPQLPVTLSFKVSFNTVSN